jgi:flagella basal body P-ring formation protein FlgA
MKILVTALSALLCLAAPAAPAAHAQDGARESHTVLRTTVEQFLKTRSAGLPGDIHISVGAIDPRLSLPACQAPEAFLPNGSRIWGRTTVGVRCSVPAPWTVYITATVKVIGQYVVTAAPLAQGQVVAANDLAMLQGDLTALPPGIITDTGQAIGRTVTMSLRAGAPLRGDTLRSQPAVTQGQVVRLVTNGPGFQVSAEGRALASGAEGQVVQARTGSGQVVSGVARAGGILDVTY